VLETKAHSSSKESDIDRKSRELAKRFATTNEYVKQRLSDIEQESITLNLKRIHSLPMDKAYTELLQPARFEYMSMKNEKKASGDKMYTHSYNDMAMQH